MRMKEYLLPFFVFLISFFILAGLFVFGEITSVVLSLIIAVLFFNFGKEKSLATKESIEYKNEELDRDYEFGGIGDANPRKGTEAYRVQEEVRIRKKIAEEKQVKELVSDLYFDVIKYYPSWLKDKRNQENVSSIVTQATARKEEGNKRERDKEITEIILNGKDYKFVFQESSFDTPDGEYHMQGLLELFSGDRKLLAVNVSRDFLRQFLSEWKPFSIEAFIDGDWIEDFRALKKARQKDEIERSVKEAEDPNRTAKLKKDFGVE